MSFVSLPVPGGLSNLILRGSLQHASSSRILSSVRLLQTGHHQSDPAAGCPPQEGCLLVRDSHTHTYKHGHTRTVITIKCVCVRVCVQADGRGPASAVGKEGLLSGRECSSASGPGQRPLLAVGMSAGHLRPLEAVGVPGSPGRPWTPARFVCLHPLPPSSPRLSAILSEIIIGVASLCVCVCVLQFPGPGAEKDGGPVDGLHVGSGVARLSASAGPGNPCFYFVTDFVSC